MEVVPPSNNFIINISKYLVTIEEGAGQKWSSVKFQEHTTSYSEPYFWRMKDVYIWIEN